MPISSCVIRVAAARATNTISSPSSTAIEHDLPVALRKFATVGMVAAAILALFVKRHGKGVARLIDGVVKVPAAIASIVLAVGFVLAFSGPPFNLNGTLLILNSFRDLRQHF